MKILFLIVALAAGLESASLLAGKPSYTVLAERQISDGNTLRVLRGSDIGITQLAGIPFVAA